MSTKTSYEEPLHSLKQKLEEIADPQGALAYAVVIGPQFRHTSDDTLLWKTLTPTAELPFELDDNGSIVVATSGVDSAYTKIFIKDAEASLWTGKAGSIYTNLPGGKYLSFDTAFLDTTNAAVATAFDQGRPPQPGDILTIDDGGTPVKRKVVRIVGEDTDATIGSFEQYGVNTLGASAAATTSSSVTWTSAFAVGVLDATILDRWFRNYGTIGAQDGLRAVFEIECTAAGADADAATFELRVNGIVVAGTVAMNVDDVEASFALPGIVAVTEAVKLSAEYTGAWVIGDLVTLNVDYAAAALVDVEDSYFQASDLSGYNMGNGTKKIAGQLAYTVLSVAEDGDVILRLESLNGLAFQQEITMTSAADLLVTVAYDGGTIEFTLDATVYTTAYTGLRTAATILPPAFSTTVFDKVELASITGLTGAVTIDGAYVYNGTLPAERLAASNYTATETEVTLESPEVLVPAYPATTWKPLLTAGTAAVVWRQIQLPEEGEQLITITSQDDITDKLGSDHPDSEVGYGALCALIGGEGKEIRVLRTTGATADDFSSALQRIESIRSAYALGVLTTDDDVMMEAITHTRAMSDEKIKHFRRVFVGTDSPGEYNLIDTREDSSPYLADVVTGDNGFNLVNAVDVDLDFTGVSTGDYLLVVAQGTRYKITGVTDTTLTLESGPGAALASTAVKVVAADTSANTVKFVKARTAALRLTKDDDRRLVNAWCHKGRVSIGGASYTQKMRFYACEAAGARAALPPHQGQTRRTVSTIQSAPGMYLNFTREQLNELGAAGVWIVTQNGADLPVHVRHQITTAVEGGLLYYEDSVGTNLDLISFEWDDVIDPSIGKVNANRRSQFNLKSKVIDLLARLSTEEQSDDGRRLGPRIERFFSLAGVENSVTMDLSPLFRDQFDSGAILELPSPLNRVKTVILGRAIRGEDGGVITSLSTSTEA